MRIYILLLSSLFLFSYDEKPKILFIDGTKLHFDDIYSINHKIDSISYVIKEFKASVEGGCYKGNQFLLLDEIYPLLDKKINKHIQKKYEFTAFQFTQDKNTFSINVTDEIFIDKFCHNTKKVSVIAQALIFNIYAEGEIYIHIIVNKVKLER